MGYVEQNLGKNEVVVKKADRNGFSRFFYV